MPWMDDAGSDATLQTGSSGRRSGTWRVADREDADIRAVTLLCLFLIAFATSSDSSLSAPDLEPDG